MLKRLLAARELGIFVVLLVEVAIFAWLLREPGRPNLFLQPAQALAIVRDSAALGLAAIGASIVIISGGIDLAVGSNIALVSVVIGALLAGGQPAGVAVVGGLAAGTASGLVSAALITRFALPAFIVTLGMMSIVRGVAFLITGGSTVPILAAGFTRGLGGDIDVGGLPVPVPALVLLAVAGGFALFMGRTALGRAIFAVGGNEEAARLSGVRVTRVKHVVYAIAGLTAGLSGAVFAAYYGTGQSTAAIGWELDAIAAAVLGGASLSGGRGSVWGAILGAIIFRVLRSGLTMTNASRYEQVIVGLVVIAAVVLDQVTTRRTRG